MGGHEEPNPYGVLTMTNRVAELKQAFTALYGEAPSVTVRAPGRINLIGEHTDYSLLPVLPLAIPLGTRVAAASDSGGLVTASSRQFQGTARLERGGLGQLPATPWHRYLWGALKMLEGRGAPDSGARLLIEGDLPTTGGLSSSSSFTMAVLLGLSELWGLGLSAEELVALAIVAERQVGVESGGMDQTIIGLARAGAALRIDFEPPAVRAVALPEELRLVVAYSGEQAPKGGSARDAYNERVVGCRLAAALLGARLGVEPGTPPVLGRLAGLAGEEEIARLPERGCAAAVAREAGVEVDVLVKLTAGVFSDAADVWVRPAASHVLSEARRVDAAEQALGAGDLAGLGRLMDASHGSLAEDYRCSTPGLDRLCQAMRNGGALGARLTGAGFGGYAIAAATPDTVEAVLAAANQVSPGPVFLATAAGGMERL